MKKALLIILCAVVIAAAGLQTFLNRRPPGFSPGKWILAHMGIPEEQGELGDCYKFGSGANTGKALYWYRKGAEGGSPAAQFGLGLCHADGTIKPKSHEKAALLFQQSAEGGYGWAQFFLAEYYEKGIGLPKNSELSFKWMARAAENGLAFARNKLGDYYEKGFGTPRDYVKAHLWYSLAEKAGARATQRFELEKKMSQNQIAEAQKAAREWKPLQALPAGN